MTSPNSSRGGTLVGELGMAIEGSSSLKIKKAELQPYKEFFSPSVVMSSTTNKTSMVIANVHSETKKKPLGGLFTKPPLDTHTGIKNQVHYSSRT